MFRVSEWPEALNPEVCLLKTPFALSRLKLLTVADRLVGCWPS